MRNKFFSAFFAAFFVSMGLMVSSASARVVVDGFADLAETVSPAVVSIYSTPRVSGELEILQQRYSGRRKSLGAGFFIDAAGTMVTTDHIIGDNDDLIIKLSDGREFSAAIRGRDRETDLAVLEITDAETARFPFLKFGDSEKARPGDWVMAIGNPFGLGRSISIGIISAVHRDLQAGQYDDFIQTDAAVNRGSSGGPLFNVKGDVIGVLTAIYSQTGGSVGVGFAVPSDLAGTIVSQILEFGAAQRGWLGVSIDDVTPAQAKEIGLRTPRGASVSAVRPESPASEAGIRAGDVILSYNRQRILNTRHLSREVAETTVGEAVHVVVLRDRRRVSLSVTVAQRALLARAAATGPVPEGAARASGVTLQDPTPEILDQFGLSEMTSGIVVIAVDPESPAAMVLQPGDVIHEIGWERMNSAQEAAEKLNKLRDLNSGPVQIYVQRGNLLFYESLRP